MVFPGEPFFGRDRFDVLRRCLQQTGRTGRTWLSREGPDQQGRATSGSTGTG
jgi:hypothetical protein